MKQWVKIFLSFLFGKEISPDVNWVYPKDSSWMLDDDLNINYKLVKECPYFKSLIGVGHSYRWHKEGDPFDHTLLVCKNMHKLIKEKGFYLSNYDKKILMVAALCHDLGKATTTFFDENDQEWHCKNHGLEGSKITRELLQDDDIKFREEICWLVRHHMVFHNLFFKSKEKQISEIIKLSNGNSTVEKLGWLNYADTLGSISSENNINIIQERMNKIGDMATKHKCLTTPATKPALHKDIFKMFVMIGLPGSGKDTYIHQMLADYPCICRDDLRELAKDGQIFGRKLMLDNEGEKAITKQVNEAIKNCCSRKESFVINQTSLKRKYRDEFTSIAKQYGNPEIIYIYVEAPSVETCIERRGGGKWDDIIKRMWDGFEFPEPIEYDRLIIYKSDN